MIKWIDRLISIRTPNVFDIAKVPFSRRGSYFSVTIDHWGILGEGLYLRTHYDNSTQVFKLALMREGRELGYTVQALPGVLTLQAEGGGELQFVMEGNETARLRGRGVSLRLEMPKERWTNACEMGGGAWAINMSKHSVQVALDVMQGKIEVDTAWAQGQGFCWETSRFIADVQPSENDTFEIAVDSFLTTWIKPPRKPFDAIRKETEKEYQSWTRGLPDAQPEYKKTRDLAAYVNWSTLVAPAGNLKRETMLMSKKSMCKVYGWDHAFNAMAHCSHQPDLAWDQLMVMSDHQDAYGKCPSNMDRNVASYTVSNAPIQGWAIGRMRSENPAMFTQDRLAQVYDYLSRWSDWLCQYRTWEGDELPYYQHGFDSGWDNSTIFDVGVPIVSPDQPAYLILQMEELADIAAALGRDKEAAHWQQRAKDMLEALIDELWQKDRFVGKLRPSGEIVECDSLIVCMPMVLGKRLPETVIKPLVARIRDHLTGFGLATEKLESEHYLEAGYWRGPIWAPSTMLITTGLEEVGEKELARTIKQNFCDMCKRVGFYENFSPKTGQGNHCPAYTWTSSVFMIYANELSLGG